MSTSVNAVDGTTATVKPGEILCLTAGKRGGVTFKNLTGSKASPITIKNCGGLVELSSTLRVYGSRYIRVTGSGHAGLTYGLKISAPTKAQGVDISQYTSDVEVDHVEVAASNFAGIMAKTDGADPKSFTQYNTRIHHNYIHDVAGEGLYLGNSFYGETTAHAMVGTRVHHNIVINAGWDGIQVGAADDDTEIYDNYVENAGSKTTQFMHQNAFQMGGGTRGRFYGNVVVRPKAHGLIMLGLGDTHVYNNIFIEPGADGVWFSPRYFTRSGSHPVGVVAYNTIIEPGDQGVQWHSSAVTTDNHLKNNIVIDGGGKYVDVHPSKTVKQSNNHYAKDASSAVFAGTISYASLSKLPVGQRRQAVIKAYGLLKGSSAIDKGICIPALGISTDINETPRPQGGSCDIGAIEHGTSSIGLDSGSGVDGGVLTDGYTSDLAPSDQSMGREASIQDGSSGGDAGQPAGDDGCSCRLGEAAPDGAVWLLVFLCLFVLVWRRFD